MTKPELKKLYELQGLRFTKMTGTGNDFIFIDGREEQVPDEAKPLLAEALCRRGLSVGADGLVILRPVDRVDADKGKIDFAWDFFNSDGSEAEMCGNAGRCAARFAHDRGLAQQEMVFDTLAGPISAWVGSGQPPLIKLELTPPFGSYHDLKIKAAGKEYILDGINTGVPHAVILIDDLKGAPVREVGREIRFHDHFAPAGTNVNFASFQRQELWVRTYERGVEDETLACGTGVVASALLAGAKKGLDSPVTVHVHSGEVLKVYFQAEGDDFKGIHLEGPASYVYDGVVNGEAFAWLESKKGE